MTSGVEEKNGKVFRGEASLDGGEGATILFGGNLHWSIGGGDVFH